MRWLIFLSRVAFLCGILMLLAFLLLFMKWEQEDTLYSSIIMAGYGLAAIVLPITNIVYLILTVFGKNPRRWVHPWLLTCNIIFFIILLGFFFYVNDPYYQQLSN